MALLALAANNTPPLNLLPYDGVATACDGRTHVVGRTPFPSNVDPSNLLTGICYCVVTGTSENSDVAASAALEEIGITLTVEGGNTI